MAPALNRGHGSVGESDEKKRKNEEAKKRSEALKEVISLRGEDRLTWAVILNEVKDL